MELIMFNNVKEKAKNIFLTLHFVRQKKMSSSHLKFIIRTPTILR